MLTRQELFEALCNMTPIRHNGVGYQILAIELEDGSGYSFCLTVRNLDTAKTEKAYLRCPQPKTDARLILAEDNILI